MGKTMKPAGAVKTTGCKPFAGFVIGIMRSVHSAGVPGAQ